MCQILNQTILKAFKKSVEVLYDFSKKKRFDQFVSLAMVIAGWYFSKSFFVAPVCAGAFFCFWSVLKDAHVGEIHKERMIAPLLFMGAFLLWVCPIIQNRIDPPELFIHTPANQSDAKQILVTIENKGKSELPKNDSQIFFGLVKNMDTKEIEWVQTNYMTTIKRNRLSTFSFNRPIISNGNPFSIVAVKSKRLPKFYELEPFYSDNKGGRWLPYYDNIGLVNGGDIKKMEGVLESIENCVESHNIDGGRTKCFETKTSSPT